jgi:ribosomal protein S18 acetylase RimI-like enzyme
VITISEVRQVDEATVAAVAHLLPQLSRSSAPPSAAELTELVTSPATTLFSATTDDGTMVGMLTLALFRIPTGVRAWIEDVVVDDAVRGSGAATGLTQAALDAARAAGARTVDLTSRPSREAANRLYQRIGFEARETNVYRYTLV